MQKFKELINEFTFGDELILPDIDPMKLESIDWKNYKIYFFNEWESGSYSYTPQVFDIFTKQHFHPDQTSDCFLLNFEQEGQPRWEAGCFEAGGTGTFDHKRSTAYAIPNDKYIVIDWIRPVEEYPYLILSEPTDISLDGYPPVSGIFDNSLTFDEYQKFMEIFNSYNYSA